MTWEFQITAEAAENIVLLSERMEFFPDSDGETTDLSVPRIKRKFKDFIGQNKSLFRNVKQDLLNEFDQTPTKVMKFPGPPTQAAHTSMASVSENGIVEKLMQELVLKDADIKSLEAAVINWQKKVSKLELNSTDLQINHDKEIAKMTAIRDTEVVKMSEIQSKLQYLLEKERAVIVQYEDLKKDFDKQKIKMDKEILRITREKLEEGDKAQQLRARWMETEESLRKELMTLKSDNAVLKTKYEEAESQLELRKRVQQENVDQNKKVKELLTELKEERDKIKELNKTMSDHEDAIVITKALKNDLDLVPSLKQELEKLQLDNEQLRHNEQNTLLLEEELRCAKQKVEESVVKCEKFAELEIANEDLQARLQRWEASDSSGSRRPQSPSSLSRRVNELETSRALMLLKQGELETELKREKLKMEQVVLDKEQLAKDLSVERSTVTQQNDLIKRLKRKVLLLAKERDSFKSVLDSYESEATVNVDALNQRRIQQLESLVEEYQHQNGDNESHINSLEEKLAAVEISYNKVQQQLLKLETSRERLQSNIQSHDDIRQLKEQLAAMENSLLKVQEEKDILEARIEQRQLQGEYDPSKVNIVHFINNPFCEVQATQKELMKNLSAENDSLRKRNEILESNEGRIEDLTMQVNEKLQEPSPTKELEAMKKELTTQETRNKRLREVYSKISREFREICYQLTGYKIDILCANQYRLTNMYSMSPNEYLWFQQNDQGEIQLLETDFSNSLKELMELYLQKQHSIPLFLSQITMDLYGKQTMILE